MALSLDSRNSTILVTGAASGLGLALARAFAKRGAGVGMLDADGDRLAAAVAQIRALGANADGYVCDVRDDAAVDAAVESAWSRLGPIDLLCANAGVVSRGSILEISRAEFDWVLGVNAWGVVNAAKSYARRARAAKLAGHILVTGSENSLSHPKLVRNFAIDAYLASKHAALAIADQLRHQLAPDGIGVSIVCPGAFKSGLGANSKSLRPVSAGAGERRPAVDPDPASSKAMAAMSISADAVAELAIRGMQAGLYFIPTHAVIRDDVEGRYREILGAFDALGIR